MESGKQKDKMLKSFQVRSFIYSMVPFPKLKDPFNKVMAVRERLLNPKGTRVDVLALVS